MAAGDETTDDAPVLKLNFIRDVAADVDFFGSHERVAKAVAEVIASNDDLKVIGLLGRWGSGKSTVVRHIQKRLNAVDKETGGKTHVFCYDAWLHQSDPPRRSFLETMVGFLDEQGLTKRERWQLDLDILNGQVEDTTSTSTPAFTPMGYVFLLSLILVPLGLQYIGHDWFAAAGQPGARFPITHIYLGGWILLVVPLLVALATFIFGGKGRHALLALFVNRQVQTQVNRVTRSPDPTTIEFQRIFRKIIAEIDPKKRLIFVIDNLDRLHEAEAVAMWNTIRSFFLGSEHADLLSRGRQLPTVLLPIDQDAVERIYSKEHGSDLGRRLARSFMDKTFDLSFHVPPPVLSDWNAYLKDQMEAMFGEAFNPNWAYQAGRLYEARTRMGEEITPRAINVTLNAIAALWLQWRATIPFVTIAYYVAFKDEVEKNIYAAVGTPFVHIADVDPDWQRGLAALHFGAPPDKAIQVLLEPRLRAAFDEWDANAFRDLAVYPGFAETLQRLLDDRQPARMPFVSQVSHVLTELAPEPSAWVDAAWAALREMFIRGQPYETLDDWDRDTLQSLLSTCPDALLPSYLARVAQRLSGTMEPVFGNDEEARPVYIRLIETLAEAASKSKVSDLKVRFAGGADSYLATMQYASEMPEAARMLVYTGTDQQLADALTAQMTGIIAAGLVGARFQAIMRGERKAKWDSLIEASRKHLAEQNGTKGGTLPAAEILGYFWKSSEKAKTAVRDLRDNGHLSQRVAENNTSGRHKTLASLVALTFVVEGTLENGVSWADVIKATPDFPDLVREAMDRFDESGTLDRVVKVYRESPAALPLCRAIATGRTQKWTLGTLKLNDVIEHFAAYLNCVEAPHQPRFLALLAGYNRLWEVLEKRGFDEPTRRLLTAWATGGVVASDHAKKARSLLKAKLQATSAADWTRAIEGGTPPFAAARELAGASGAPANSGVNLFEALNALLPKVLERPTSDWAARWFEAAGFLSSASRKALHRNLRDRLMATPVPLLPDLLNAAGDLFVSDAQFGALPEGAVRHVVVPLIAADAGVAWLELHGAEVGDWVKAAPPEARLFLKEQAKHQLKELPTTAARKPLKMMLAGWGL